jgi:hypothetical protein
LNCGDEFNVDMFNMEDKFHSRMSELALILLDNLVFCSLYIKKQYANTLLTLISNQIKLNIENLNEQVVWLQRENLLKNFSKDKKKPFRVAKPRIDNFH